MAVDPNFEREAGEDVGYVPPSYVSTDWAGLADLAAGRTDYRSINFGTTFPASSRSLNGTYTVLSVTSDTIVLSNPGLVAPAWLTLDGETAEISATLSTSGDRWIGPFIVEAEDTQRLIANFVALSGLYKDDGDKKFLAFPVTVRVEATPVDPDDDPVGPAETFDVTVAGNDDKNKRDTRAATRIADPTFTGRMSVRAMRVTPTDLAFKGTVVDEVKWKELYGVSDADVSLLGNVTTIHSRTYATASALSVKERKLSMIATRRLPQRELDGSFSEDLFATTDIADIISAIALDPYLGALTEAEVDFDNIYDTLDAVEAYFGTEAVREFGYTFDDDQMSAEETLALIAQAAFCIAYRRGRVLRLSFEHATEDSTLLFNRRNVLPGSTERTTRFGVLNDQDGVELDYADPDRRKALTFFIPPDRSAVKPRNVQTPGLNATSAYFHAWRSWFKMAHQHITAAFEATQEAGLVLRGERILLSDMTRPERIDGEVEAQDGATLFLSRDVELDPDRDWVIFLQHLDATVEVLGVESWVPGVGEEDDLTRVVLSAEPRLALVVEDGVAVGKAKFIIATSDDSQVRAFIVTERDPQSRFTERVTAVNYSFLYYQNDQLALWLPVLGTAIEEQSVNRLAVVEAGGVTVEVDAVRQKRVIASVPGASLTFPGSPVAPASYTKAAWLWADADTAANVLGAGAEVFGTDGAGNVRANHGAGGVSAAIPALAEWHHWAVAYDEDSETMTLYLDGAVVDQEVAVARGALAAPAALDGFHGSVDEVRLWTRALTLAEVRDVYRGSLPPPV